MIKRRAGMQGLGVSICWSCCQLSDEKERETIDPALIHQ